MHEHLDRALENLLSTTGTEDLFQKVLERLEDDYSQKAVREVLSLIWASRGGLSEEDLEALTGISRLKLSTLLLGLDYHLVRREGVLTFFHDYLRRAVEKRYLAQSSTREDRYRLLAAHFEQVEITPRSTLESLHALEKSGDRDRLDAVASQIERFVPLWRSDEYEVLRLWALRDLSEVTGTYRASLERWEHEQRSTEDHIAVLGAVGELFERVGAWSEAEPIARRRLDLSRRAGDRDAEVSTLSYLVDLARNLGRPEEAERIARQAEAIARELGDGRAIIRSVASRASLHADRGQYSEALACYDEWEEKARELGARLLYRMGGDCA
jgi:tetratricopeptide (TPR) repeat protein